MIQDLKHSIRRVPMVKIRNIKDHDKPPGGRTVFMEMTLLMMSQKI